MRFIRSILLLAVFACFGFSTAAVTTTIDLRPATAILNSCPGSFATTAQTDHVIIKGGSVTRGVILQCTVAWDYIDPNTSKVIHLLASQTHKLTISANSDYTFDTSRVGADGVVTVMIVK